MPSQTTRGRPRSGNRPAPSKVRSNRDTSAAASRVALVTSSSRSSGVQPRKARVRWRFSALTRRRAGRVVGSTPAARAARSVGSGIAMKRRTRRRVLGCYLEGRCADLVADEQRQEGEGQKDRERPERGHTRRLTAFHTGKCCDDQVCHRHVLQAIAVPDVAGECLLSRCRCWCGALALFTLLAATLFSRRSAGGRLIRG